MPVDPTCTSLDAIISGMGACWTDARGQLLSALEIIHDSLNCSDDVCNPQRSCVRQVQTNVPVEQFVQYGWGQAPPSAFDCPILYVVRGCEVWIGVNSPSCNLYIASGWCQVCAGAQQQRANVRDLITNSGTDLLFAVAGTYTTPKKRPWSAIQFANAGLVVLGADTFTLPTGKYYITCNIESVHASTPPTAASVFESRLQDLTNAVTIKQMQKTTRANNAPAREMSYQSCRAYVDITVPLIAFAVESYFSATGGGGYSVNCAGNDEVLIEVV